MSESKFVGAGILALVAVLVVPSVSLAISPAVGLGSTGVVRQLRAAHKLLAEADRDYNGQRARAAEEVRKAIEELSGGREAKTTTTNTLAAKAIESAIKRKEPDGHEPQVNSDAQLRQAQSILQSALSELNSSQPKAAENVQAAIGHINKATRGQIGPQRERRGGYRGFWAAEGTSASACGDGGDYLRACLKSAVGSRSLEEVSYAA